MKEKDLLDEKFKASTCGFIATVVSILALGLQAAGHHLWSGIGFSAVAVLLAFALNSLKYILFDSKIVELKKDMLDRLSNKIDRSVYCDWDRINEASLESIRAELSQLHMSQAVGDPIYSSRKRLESLQAQFDAVNEHYGIEIEKVEAGYRVK